MRSAVSPRWAFGGQNQLEDVTVERLAFVHAAADQGPEAGSGDIQGRLRGVLPVALSIHVNRHLQSVALGHDEPNAVVVATGAQALHHVQPLSWNM